MTLAFRLEEAKSSNFLSLNVKWNWHRFNAFVIYSEVQIDLPLCLENEIHLPVEDYRCGQALFSILFQANNLLSVINKGIKQSSSSLERYILYGSSVAKPWNDSLFELNVAVVDDSRIFFF